MEGRIITALAPSLAAGLAGVALAGCVAVPIPRGEGTVTEGREVTQDQSAAIAIGGTSRATLLGQLGEPQAVWEERNILVYAWDRVHLSILWMLAGRGAGAAGLMDVPTHYLLLIQLDAAGVVRRAERCIRPLQQDYGSFLRAWADGRTCH